MADASAFDPDLRGHLEAQIASAADELAYSAHDLDDGLRSGLILPAQLEDLHLWKRLREAAGEDADPSEDLGRHRLIRELIGWEVDHLLSQTSDNLARAKVASSLDIQKLNANVVGFSPSQAEENRELKDFLYERMYRHPRVLAMQAEAERTVVSLFGVYTSRPETLPADVQLRISTEGLPRAVCDYIAGMTDRFAALEWERLSA